MSSEKDIQRALKWNRENPDRHRMAVKNCADRLYRESWNFDLRKYKLPEEVEVLDYHRCKFNGMSYHISLSGYLIANKQIGRDRSGKLIYEPHRLHRDIFKYYNNTDIPKDCQIHHIDGDVTNNLLSNLMLVHKDEHKILHNKKVRA